MSALTQNFSVVRKDTSVAALEARPMPHVPDDYILVRTQAVALNPTDWTTLDAPGRPDQGVGVDYAGIVERVGAGVTRFKPGDRVAGVAHGGNDLNHEHGAFQRWIAVKEAIQLHIPDEITFEDALVGSAVATVGYALYHILGLPWPGQASESESNKDQPILIYGGSTATGTMAIQFAKQSGRKVLTTASPKHFELLKSRGADAVYDYHDPNVGKQIRHDTNNSLATVLDCVNTESTVAIIAEAMGSSGGTSVNLLAVDIPRPDVTNVFFLGYSMSGEDYIFEGKFEKALPDVYEFTVPWFEFCDKRWQQGHIVSHPKNVRKGGLLGTMEGMEEMRAGRGPSGEKLVYVVDDTQWPAI